MAHAARGGRRLQVSATQVSAGDAHSLVLLADGTMRAFGSGTYGQLGYGFNTNVGNSESSLPSLQGPVPLGGNAIAVSAGAQHSLVLLEGGSVKAFGNGNNGRLGYGTTTNVGDTHITLPSSQGNVQLDSTAAGVAAGGRHSLVLLADGYVMSFGAAGFGQLGYGSISDVGGTYSRMPSDVGTVPLKSTVVAVAAGGEHSMVLFSDYSLQTFGFGKYGRLGYGSTDDVGGMDSAWSSKTDPVPLGGLAVAVAAGTSHSLVLLANGTVRAFGLGESGQLGYGSTSKVGDKASTLPSDQGPVPLGGTAAAVAAGDAFSLVLLTNGSILAFGDGARGNLGYGSIDDVGYDEATLPSDKGPVPLGGTAVALSAGGSHSLVVLDDGTVRSFGYGNFGQLGYGSPDDIGESPQTLPSKKGPVPLTLPSATASPSPSASASPSAAATSSPTASSTATPSPTASPSATATSTVTSSPTASPSATSSSTPTPSSTATATTTPSPTPSPSTSPTATASSTASPTGTPTPTQTPSPSHTASPSASPSPSGGASGSIGLNGAGSGGAADDAAMPFIVIGAVAGGALLVGGAAWAMKQTTLGQLAARSATAGASDSAGAGAVQQDGGVSGEATAVGGVGGLSSLGAELPASGGSRV
ncbi:hypothetical protein FNF27_05079 [Cafeteria roenbergensis]|uniref:RCC1-like domain-containing protein n=1 Tax=Cafeteria roenbergensis TaxID=33653 RepID=A0A5A8E7H3_CAFRO|nr:hypothetical protein FNF27_05079 [Cafeteria roenbergensis]